MFTYTPKGTCSRQIIFEVDNENKVHNLRFVGGCNGNLQGVAKLVEGQDVDEIIRRVSGIQCRNGTSCPDQLSKALLAYKAAKEEAAKAAAEAENTETNEN